MEKKYIIFYPWQLYATTLSDFIWSANTFTHVVNSFWNNIIRREQTFSGPPPKISTLDEKNAFFLDKGYKYTLCSQKFHTMTEDIFE